ncbi:MAG: hypothetical protein NTY76_06665 [Candidatus Omnitrophica bacterium]|nr:hypothetical protein [Candidatus Omnitrophota bacterium]
MKKIIGQLLGLVLGVIIISQVFFEYGAVKAVDEDPSSASQEKSAELVTPRGTIYVGMKKEDLEDILQEWNRKFAPNYVLNKGWLIYRDITSNNPNDTITIYTTSGKVTGWDRSYVPSPENKGSKYEYREGERIDVWFFPKEKSRWNGYELNILDWNKLIRLQKVMFLLEYVKQLNEEYKTDISVDINKYILAMDFYASNFPEAGKGVAAVSGVNSLLISDGKAKPLPKTQTQ